MSKDTVPLKKTIISFKRFKERMATHYPLFEFHIFKDTPLNGYDFSHTTFDNCTFRVHRTTGYSNLSLKYATFMGCTFENINFMNVDFSNADFLSCKFVDCVFNNCVFNCARFSETTFYGCKITRSVFRWTVINKCYFSKSTFITTSCIFSDLGIHDTQGLDCIPMACPSEGAFIGWKKVRVWIANETVGLPIGNYLIKLQIPARAKRSSATSNKCRCSEAKVLGIYDEKGEKKIHATHVYNDNFGVVGVDYVVGKTVYPDIFDENRWNECSHGIHFFINKSDAINYDL